MNGHDGTPVAVTLERARSLANEALWTVRLQCRRVRTTEPEDQEFVVRWWVDLQFLIIALRRLHRAAELAKSAVPSVQTAIEAFDAALPDLKLMRDVGEHINAYAVDSLARHNKTVDRRVLQVGTWDGTTYHWLGGAINIDDAATAATSLFVAIRNSSPPARR